MNVELGGFGGLSNNMPVFGNNHVGKRQRSRNVWATPASTQDIGDTAEAHDRHMTEKGQKNSRFTVAAIRGALKIGDDGQPVPVGPEILQRFDDAVKRYNESRAQAQAKPKAAPRGGTSSSMIIIEPDEVKHGIVLSAAQALDNDQYYAMLDSGTNVIIVPLHPSMQGEIAECQVPSATVTGPIVQVCEFDGARRLVVALPNSAILVSQEWLTTIAGWTFVSGPKPGLQNSVCENKVYPAGAKTSFVLSMNKKNGPPYLSKELFWRAMEEIAGKAKLISGHKWSELKTCLTIEIVSHSLKCIQSRQLLSLKRPAQGGVERDSSQSALHTNQC